MGQLIQATCSCSYKEDFYIGSGLLSSNLQIAKTMVDENTLDQMEKWLEINELKNVKAEYFLASCGTCGNITSMPQVTLFSQDIVKEFKSSCDCGTNYHILEDVFKKCTPCPVCKENLHFEKTGSWD